jgi:hypothetical protein
VADGWAWAALGLLLLLLGIRAWVVETGHATLGRTPVKVKVLTGACAVAAVLVTGTVTADGGTRLVYLLLHPAQAQALEDAEKAANDAARQAAEAAEDAADDAAPDPTAAPTAPVAGQPAPPAAPGPGGPGGP